MKRDAMSESPRCAPSLAPLRILLLEDVPLDASLIEARLRAVDMAFCLQVVVTEAEFHRALGEFTPDLILSDYNLPTFDGMTALTIVREVCRDTPFIFVSGAIGEESAIALLRKGATDLVLKHNLSRLGPAVARALHEREQRTEARRAVKALRETIDVLRSTKRSFKSKTLGELRLKLEQLVETTPWW